MVCVGVVTADVERFRCNQRRVRFAEEMMRRSLLTFNLFVPLALVSSGGCSLGLEFDDCSTDAQCPGADVCVNGACEPIAFGTTGGGGCRPSEAEPCVCTDGGVGVQVCQATGAFGPCECAQDPESSTGPAPQDPSSSSTADSSSTTTGSDESSESTTTSGDTDADRCVTVVPSMLVRDQGSTPKPESARFFLTLGELGLGGDAPDEFRLEYWFGEGEGVADLGSTANVQYATCRACIRVIEDVGAETVREDFFDGTQYLQTEGTLVTADDPHDGEVSVTLEGVRLVEVTFDGVVSEPLEDGQCITLADGTYSTPTAPRAWTCADAAFADIVCSCGCGEPDGACADNSLQSCESCDEVGSCAQGGGECPATLDENDPTRCAPTVPPGWTCGAETYDDGICHCGCGADDSQCADATVASCEVCDAAGACGADPECSNIAPADNSTCSPQ